MIIKICKKSKKGDRRRKMAFMISINRKERKGGEKVDAWKTGEEIK